MSRPERGQVYYRITADEFTALQVAGIDFLDDFKLGLDGYYYAFSEDISEEEAIFLLENNINTDLYDYLYSTWATGNP